MHARATTCAAGASARLCCTPNCARRLAARKTAFFATKTAGSTPVEPQKKLENHNDNPSLAAEAAEVERRRARKMAMDPDDAPPEWTDAIRRFSTVISSTTIRLDDVDHQVGAAGDVRPAGQGLMKTSRKLPKLRSLRETMTEEEQSRGKLTATVLEKVLEARRGTGRTPASQTHELAQRLNVEPSAMEAVLRYHDDLPEYKTKLQDLARLAT